MSKNSKLKYAWVMFGILIAAYFFVYFHRISVAVVGQDIVDDVGGNIGYLSSIYFWTYAAMQIPCGMLVDRFGPRKISFIFLTIAAAGSLLTALGESFTAVAFGKILIAAGMASVYIPLMKVVSIWFPPHYFPQLNGIIIAVGNVGALAATVPLQVIVDFLGWRDTFMALMVITLILAVLCLLLIKELPSKKAGTEDSIGMFRGLKTVFSSGRKFWPMAISYFLVYGSIMVFQGTYAKVYFNTFHSFAGLTIWIVSMISIGKVFSIAASGILTGRGIIKSKRSAMLWGTLGYSAVWLIMWLFIGGLDSVWFWGIVSTLFGFFGGFMSLSFSQVKEWHPLSLSATSVGALNVFIFLGASVATTLSGLIIGEYPYSLVDFSAVWGLMFMFSAIAVLAIYLSKENVTVSRQQL